MANAINIIIIASLVGAIIWGLYKGLTSQIVGILGIILGIWLASKLTPNIAAWINEYFGGEHSLDIIKIVVYVVLLIIIVILCKLLGKLLDKVFNLTILGVVNKVLGAVFCLLKVILILAVVASLINYIGETMSLDSVKNLKESQSFSYLLQVSDKVLPYLKSMLYKQ